MCFGQSAPLPAGTEIIRLTRFALRTRYHLNHSDCKEVIAMATHFQMVTLEFELFSNIREIASLLNWSTPSNNLIKLNVVNE